MKILSVIELKNSIDPIKKANIYKNKYVAIKGYLNDGKLFESEQDSLSNTVNSVNLNPRIHSGLLRKLFKSKQIESMKGEVMIVCKIIQFTYPEIEQIVAVKLFDKSGKEIGFEQLEADNLPLELRGKDLLPKKILNYVKKDSHNL